MKTAVADISFHIILAPPCLEFCTDVPLYQIFLLFGQFPPQPGRQIDVKISALSLSTPPCPTPTLLYCTCTV